MSSLVDWADWYKLAKVTAGTKVHKTTVTIKNKKKKNSGLFKSSLISMTSYNRSGYRQKCVMLKNIALQRLTLVRIFSDTSHWIQGASIERKGFKCFDDQWSWLLLNVAH